MNIPEGNPGLLYLPELPADIFHQPPGHAGSYHPLSPGSQTPRLAASQFQTGQLDY